MGLKVLGINYGGHDTSACITNNGKLLAACEQERYDYIKHSRAFPIDAINDCLKISKLKIDDIDIISFAAIPKLIVKERYEKLQKRFPERKKNIKVDKKKLNEFINMESFIRKRLGFKKKIDFNLHHLCHLYSTFGPSGFKKALVVSYDGIGEIETTLFGIGEKNSIRIINEKNKFPDSLGLFYSAITYFLGWKHHCDEGIIMGLAPYGNPNLKLKDSNKSYIDFFREMVFTHPNNPLKIKINLDWIDYHKKYDTWLSKKFFDKFGKKRNEKEKITQHHKNIAAALQQRLEEIVIKQIKLLKKKYKANYLCIAGGVGLNCSLNGSIESKKIFKEIFVQPASGDAGVAYGACLVSTKKYYKNLKLKKNWNFYSGSKLNKGQLIKELKNKKLIVKKYGNKIFDEVSKLLFEGKIIGWFQGQSEFGPRALGNRSILCKPFPKEMRDYVNKQVKFREYFRPFAPAILENYTKKYFNINQASPHMLIATQVKKNKIKKIEATVHVDNSARVQTVNKKTNLNFWKLLKSFHKISNIPVLLNTSFNIKGQPIVNSSSDAIKCFLKYNIDYLVIDEILVSKKNKN